MIVQVEVSTRCQLRCSMCPRNVFSAEWIDADMDMSTFKRIPFDRFDYVHLQGWGEPLMNPNIAEMIDIVRESGCKVGLTTNGLILKDLRLDRVVVSLASPNEEKNRRLRGGKLEDIVEGIKKYGASVAVIMMKSNVADLPAMVEFCKEHGVSELILNNLDYIPTKELEDEAIFLNKYGLEYIEEAKRLGEKLGVEVHVRPLEMEEALACAEFGSCLVTFDGKLSPCVYAHLPTRSDRMIRVFKGKLVEVEKVYFGEVWDKKAWKRFLEFNGIFQRRLSYIPLLTSLPPLPEVCRTCYKAYSI